MPGGTRENDGLETGIVGGCGRDIKRGEARGRFGTQSMGMHTRPVELAIARTHPEIAHASACSGPSESAPILGSMQESIQNPGRKPGTVRRSQVPTPSRLRFTLRAIHSSTVQISDFFSRIRSVFRELARALILLVAPLDSAGHRVELEQYLSQALPPPPPPTAAVSSRHAPLPPPTPAAWLGVAQLQAPHICVR